MGLKHGLQKLSYNLFFRRTSLYIIFILSGSIAAERGVHFAVDSWWAKKNKGKLFEDMVVEYKERGIIEQDEE